MIGKELDCLFPLFINFEGGSKNEFLRVRCGHCANCKQVRASEWNLRLAMESKYYHDIAFATLTYNNANVPYNIVSSCLLSKRNKNYSDNEELVSKVLTLDKKAIQLFIKRLRKRLDYKIKYYAVGEYGSNTKRPHYHIMIFGLKQCDYKFIEDSWKLGFVDVKPAFLETCTYIAGYIQKKLYGEFADPFKVSEFLRCSQHLGERYFMDTIEDYTEEHPYIVFQGYKHPIPKRFREILYERGKLRKMTCFELREKQLYEYYLLGKDLKNKGIEDASVFFRQRVKNALHKQKMKTASRDKNMEV